MKKFFLFALAFAFVGLTGCTDETNTEVTDIDADTTMVEDMGATDPMMGADTTGMGGMMGGDTTGMGAGSMGAGTMGGDTTGMGAGTMMGDSAAAAPVGQ